MSKTSASTTVLLYSHDRSTREQVRLAVGRRPASDLGDVRFLECATAPAVLSALEEGGIDVCVLDGEAVPTGGMGLCRQIKDEIYSSPPMLLLIGRPQDAWLATWSRGDAAVPHPLDPMTVAQTLATLIREFVRPPAPRRSEGPQEHCA